MELVFLGMNDIGRRIYDWLCNRESCRVTALATTKEQLSLVETVEPDIVVSVGYNHLVPEDVLSIPPDGCLNLHPSYLPYNRGKSPNVWSIVNGTPAGVSLHYMDAGFDTGPIIARRKVPTDFSDTGKDLHHRLEQAQFDFFTETWPDIEQGAIEPVTQDSTAGTYYSIDDFKQLCELNRDETYTPTELLNILRALTFPPFDNAYIELEGTRYYVDVDIRTEESTPQKDPDGMLSSY